MSASARSSACFLTTARHTVPLVISVTTAADRVVNVLRGWSDRNGQKQSHFSQAPTIQVEVKVNITIEKSEDIIPFVIKFDELSPEMKPCRVV